jgi:hypothetical protein
MRRRRIGTTHRMTSARLGVVEAVSDGGECAATEPPRRTARSGGWVAPELDDTCTEKRSVARIERGEGSPCRSGCPIDRQREVDPAGRAATDDVRLLLDQKPLCVEAAGDRDGMSAASGERERGRQQGEYATRADARPLCRQSRRSRYGPS